MELIAERGWSPTIICESAGTQAEDAAIMKKLYEEALNRI
jgi:deoxyribonuclease-4